MDLGTPPFQSLSRKAGRRNDWIRNEKRVTKESTSTEMQPPFIFM
jgi:hypothetical protein